VWDTPHITRGADVAAKPILADAVRQQMAAVGKTNMKALSLEAGLGSTFVRDVLEGRSTNPRVDSLLKLAQVLDCNLEDLLATEPSSGNEAEVKRSTESELRAARFTAARWACFGDNKAEAASVLGIHPIVLDSIEAGQVTPTDDLLTRLFERTGCPPEWVTSGRITRRMHPVIAARIGAYDLSLMADDPDPTQRD